MADRARHDVNNVDTLLAISTVGDGATVTLYADPSTHALLTSASVTLSGATIPVAGATTGVAVAIVDGAGNQITSFGGGTQYAAGATQATPTGTVALGWDGANVRALSTDSSGRQILGASSAVIGHVITDTGSTTAITGSVTVAQGTAAAITAGWPMIGGELADTTGTFTNATQTTSVTTNSFDGYSTVIVSVSGTYGTASGVFEMSDDGGTTWYSVNAARSDGGAVETGYTSLTNTNRMWTLSVSGADEFRVRSTAVASGTVNVRLSVESMPTPEAASVTIYQATAANLNATVVGTGTFVVQATLAAETTKVIGTVNISAAQTIATVTTVTAVTAITNALPAGTNLLGKVGIDQTTVGTTNAVSLAQIGATTVVNGGVAGTLAVGGVTATGAAKTGNPVRIGAVGHTANPSAVTDAQAVDLIADKLGKLVTVGSIRDLKANQVTTITTSTAETTIVTAVTSVFLDMYGIIISNISPTAVNVAIKDVTAGTTRFNFAVPAGDVRGFMLNESGAIKQSAVTNNWTATVSASVTSVVITALTIQNL